MTTRKFTLGKTGDLQARFHQASRTVSAAIQHQRDLAAQLEAELYLAVSSETARGSGRSRRPDAPRRGRKRPRLHLILECLILHREFRGIKEDLLEEAWLP